MRADGLGRLAGLLAALVGVLTLAAGVGTSWAGAPANDTFDGATPITLPYTSGAVDTTDATVAPFDDGAVGVACGVGPTVLGASNSVWYTFTAQTDAVAYVDASASNYNVYAEVVTGSPSAGFTDTYCTTAPVAQFSVRAGTTYYVDFIAFNGRGDNTGGGGILRFSIFTDQPPTVGDFDRDGAPNGRDGCPAVAAPTANGCPAEPEGAACARRDVYLTSVLPDGKTKVTVRGISLAQFVHRTVYILRDNVQVGTTVLQPNGSFTATVPAPPPGTRSRSRYQARIYNAQTEKLKLQRRMVATHLTRRDTTLTLTGRITPPFARAPARIFLQRYLSCGRKQNVPIKGVRPNAHGHFAISFQVPLQSTGVLMYRATTKVARQTGGRPDIRTFTLPRPIDTS